MADKFLTAAPPRGPLRPVPATVVILHGGSLDSHAYSGHYGVRPDFAPIGTFLFSTAAALTHEFGMPRVARNQRHPEKNAVQICHASHDISTGYAKTHSSTLPRPLDYSTATIIMLRYTSCQASRPCCTTPGILRRRAAEAGGSFRVSTAGCITFCSNNDAQRIAAW
jgi:hypothetical protein